MFFRAVILAWAEWDKEAWRQLQSILFTHMSIIQPRRMPNASSHQFYSKPALWSDEARSTLFFCQLRYERRKESWRQVTSPLCPPLPALTIWWEQSYRMFYRRGSRGGDAGTVPALEKKGMEGREEKQERKGGSVTVGSQRPQSLLLFHASLCVSRVTGKAQWSTNFTPSWARGPRIESMRQTETDSVLILCLQATWGQ